MQSKTKETQKITVYTPDSQIRSPLTLMQSMWDDLKDSRELAWRLFIRDLSAQYRQSLFGVLWAFVPPIITSLIFITLQSRNIINFGETDIPYPVYVLVGTLLWQIFTESLNAPLKSITMAKPLLVKVNFTHEALIISAFYLVLFNTIIKLIIMLAVVLLFKIQISWGLLVSIIPIFMLLLLGLCIGLFLVPIGMLYTDIASSLPVVTQLLFFVTPVVYPIPETLPFSLIAVFNPVTPILNMARDLITKGSVTTIVPFLLVSSLTIILFFVGWIIYRLALPIIIERISA
jgi:lipopolysaccharide transport system permease protein